MKATSLLLTATALVAFAGCARNRGSAGDGGAAGAPSAAASAPLASASGLPGQVTLNSTMAESLGMSIARRRWPQYHPRMATAMRLQGGYRVSIQMLEPVGAHVILDMQGNYVDGGTSNGEH